MNLAMLKPGEHGRITKIGAIGPIKRRLMDMGVLVGEKIKVEKIAPLGDPIEVTIKNLQPLPQEKRGGGDIGGGNKMSSESGVQSLELKDTKKRHHRCSCR